MKTRLNQNKDLNELLEKAKKQPLPKTTIKFLGINIPWMMLLNVIILQWLFIRLAKVTNTKFSKVTPPIERIQKKIENWNVDYEKQFNDEIGTLTSISYKLLKFIVPLTGWWNDYIYVKDLTAKWHKFRKLKYFRLVHDQFKIPEGSLMPWWCIVIRFLYMPLNTMKYVLLKWFNSDNVYHAWDDTYVIEGMRYSGELFRAMSFAELNKDAFKIVHRGVNSGEKYVTLTRIFNDDVAEYERSVGAELMSQKILDELKFPTDGKFGCKEANEIIDLMKQNNITVLTNWLESLEVKGIQIYDNAILMVKINQFDFMNVVRVKKFFGNAIKRMNKNNVIVVINKYEDIETLDEKKMNQAGWYRYDPGQDKLVPPEYQQNTSDPSEVKEGK